jgi:hypothetical protein
LELIESDDCSTYEACEACEVKKEEKKNVESLGLDRVLLYATEEGV